MSGRRHPDSPSNPRARPTAGARGPGRRPRARISGAAGRRAGDLSPRKLPTQERARATVEAILEAAVRLFAGRGYARTNTNDIARQAGVSVGSLYQYFPNKDAILTALLDRHLAEVEVAIDESLSELADQKRPLRDAVRHMLERFVAVHERDPLLARAVEEQVGQMPRLPESHHARQAEYVAVLGRVLAERPDIRGGDHAVMATLLFDVTETAIAWVAHARGGGFDRRTALDEAVEVICRYVER